MPTPLLSLFLPNRPVWLRFSSDLIILLFLQMDPGRPLALHIGSESVCYIRFSEDLFEMSPVFVNFHHTAGFAGGRPLRAVRDSQQLLHFVIQRHVSLTSFSLVGLGT